MTSSNLKLDDPEFLQSTLQANIYASYGQLSKLQKLVESGFPIDKLSNALNVSAREGHLPVVQYLTTLGLSIDSMHSAFQMSAYYGQHEIFHYFIEHTPIDIHFKEDYTLSSCILHHQFVLARYLVEHGASIEVGLTSARRLSSANPNTAQFLQWLLDYQHCQQEQAALINEVPLTCRSSLTKGRL